jgi:hypothetical protein
MSQFDFLGYERQKRAATGSYGSRAAQNAYAQFLAQQRGRRKEFDINQQYERAAPRVVSSFSKRGLAGPGVSSGVYERGLQQFDQQRLTNLSDLQRELAQEEQGFQLTDRSLRAEYDQQIADLEAQKQRAIAEAAATLQAFKPYIGG